MTWTVKQADALASVFSALDKNDIQWMVLRNYEGLPEINRAKDIDLLLDKKDFSKARDVIFLALTEVGFSYTFETIFQCIWCYSFFFSESSEIYSIKIDLLDGFVWRGAQVIEFSKLYQKRLRYNNFYVPDKVSDGFMLWVKPLMTGGFIKEKYRADILQTLTNYPEQFNMLLTTTFGENLVTQLWPLLKQGHLDETISYQKSMCYATWRKSFSKRPFQTIAATVDHYYKEILRRSCRTPASMFAVVGPDGAGKSTFIELLQQEIAHLLIKDAEAVCVQHFRPNIIPNLKKLLSGKAYDESKEEFTSPHRAKPAGRISSLLRLSYYWLDYILGYWLQTRPKCIAGKVYIFDRYFYDFIVDPHRSRINLPDWLRKLFLKIVPEPDIVFFLSCDAMIIYQRKQELTLSEIKRQLKGYQELATCNSRFITLDAQQSPQILCQKALQYTIEKSFTRLIQGND